MTGLVNKSTRPKLLPHKINRIGSSLQGACFSLRLIVVLVFKFYFCHFELISLYFFINKILNRFFNL